MSTTWLPPRPTYHLRVFVLCLALVALALTGFLFGVHMEAAVPAEAVFTAADAYEARALVAGLIEPGWYEGEAEQRFHKLRPGDELAPGQVLAAVHPDECRGQLDHVEDRLRALETRGEAAATLATVRAQRDGLRQRLGRALLRAPEGAGRWLVLEVNVSPHEAVEAGDLVATLAPLDPETRLPRAYQVKLDIDEKNLHGVEPGQPVRLASNVYNHRLYGHVEAVLSRLEPQGFAASDGTRRFRAVADVTHAPFAIPLGSGGKAEIVTGRKRVYRIILEH